MDNQMTPVERNPSDLYGAADEVAARALLGAAGDGKWPVAVVIGDELKGIARVEQWQRMSDDSHPRYGFHLLSWHGSIPRGSNAEMLWRLRPATQADIDVLAKRYKGLPSGVRIGTDGAPVVSWEIT